MEYSKKTIDHFTHPRNMGEIKDSDLMAEGGNPACGDIVKIFLKLSKNKKEISEIKFKAFGCGACLASASALTEMVQGKTVKYAEKLSRDDVDRYLDGLPQQKKKCSNFSVDVLKKALKGPHTDH